MSAHVSAAISALWMFASAQKTIHLSYYCFTGGRPALLAVLACPANAAFWDGLCWHTAVQGVATRVFGAIFENKKLRQIGTALWCVLVSEIVAAWQRIQIILRLIRF